MCMLPPQWTPLPVEPMRAMLGAAGCIGHVAGDVASVSANVVTSVSTVFVGAGSGELDFAGNYGHGIDLNNVVPTVMSLSAMVESCLCRSPGP